ncbi:MAG TPA: serine hydrolase [Propioniciclava sp.]|jgi:beta-lactamase class A|uniref:serine hydrolase n=1 Tax=Propioniciclava sp. TaxID=2038686 RepID=UPI002CDBE133|nr:serine hydrolase [Propioniciclava sp.]HRL79258.1 serine hydrolase [Propioniciclava sp.]
MSPLSRRGLLAGAAALALVACSRTADPLVTPTASPTGSVRSQLDAVMEVYARNTDLLGVSIRDRRTGAAYAFRGDFDTQSASIAKVMISLLALNKARAAGEELPFERYQQISKAIVNSDNDAADALWEWVGGGDQYTRLAVGLGLPHTHADPRSPFWSWTNTTPDDQRLLIDLLVEGTPAVAQEDRLYLLDVMSQTNAEQTWGVGHDRKKNSVDVQMKNGWVQFKSLDNLWAVNSIGRVQGEGRDYTAAFMCRRPTFEEGRDLVDAIGADVFRILGSGELV